MDIILIQHMIFIYVQNFDVLHTSTEVETHYNNWSRFFYMNNILRQLNTYSCSYRMIYFTICVFWWLDFSSNIFWKYFLRKYFLSLNTCKTIIKSMAFVNKLNNLEQIIFWTSFSSSKIWDLHYIISMLPIRSVILLIPMKI